MGGLGSRWPSVRASEGPVWPPGARPGALAWRLAPAWAGGLAVLLCPAVRPRLAPRGAPGLGLHWAAGPARTPSPHSCSGAPATRLNAPPGHRTSPRAASSLFSPPPRCALLWGRLAFAPPAAPPRRGDTHARGAPKFGKATVADTAACLSRVPASPGPSRFSRETRAANSDASLDFEAHASEARSCPRGAPRSRHQVCSAAAPRTQGSSRSALRGPRDTPGHLVSSALLPPSFHGQTAVHL